MARFRSAGRRKGRPVRAACNWPRARAAPVNEDEGLSPERDDRRVADLGPVGEFAEVDDGHLTQLSAVWKCAAVHRGHLGIGDTLAVAGKPPRRECLHGALIYTFYELGDSGSKLKLP